METYYVLPKFRNKFDLLDELDEARFESGMDVYLHNPKRDDIESLIA